MLLKKALNNKIKVVIKHHSHNITLLIYKAEEMWFSLCAQAK